MTGFALGWVACGLGAVSGRLLAMDEWQRVEAVSWPMLSLLLLVSAILGPVMLLLAVEVE